MPSDSQHAHRGYRTLDIAIAGWAKALRERANFIGLGPD